MAMLFSKLKRVALQYVKLIRLKLIIIAILQYIKQ